MDRETTRTPSKNEFWIFLAGNLATLVLTAAMDGFLVSPGAGCVTSAPITITGLPLLPSTEDLYKHSVTNIQ